MAAPPFFTFELSQAAGEFGYKTAMIFTATSLVFSYQVLL